MQTPVLLLAVILAFASVTLTHAESLSGRAVRIADGDTLTILDASNQQHRPAGPTEIGHVQTLTPVQDGTSERQIQIRWRSFAPPTRTMS